MSGVILQGKSLKIVNKGGGFATKTVVQTEKDELGKERTFHRHYQSSKRLAGSDYVVFNCPGCGKRNKRSMYDAKASAGTAISFNCNGCLREIEVAAPVSPNTIIMNTAPPAQSSQLVGPHGQQL
jgi:predicted RNA-binding Zn-ribbon protein involved in translation (DUF1610 family)